MSTDLLNLALAGLALSSMVSAGAFLAAATAGRYALRRLLRIATPDGSWRSSARSS